jgi:hypothetical protein
LNSLLLLPYSFLLGMDQFWSPDVVTYPQASPIFTALFGWSGSMPRIQAVVAVVIIFLTAVMINRLAIQHRLAKQASLLPGVVYILAMNFIPGIRGMHDVILANLLVLFMLSNAYRLIRLYDTEKLIFNMGFWAALSLIVYPGYMHLFIYLFFVLFILRSFKLIEFAQVGIGILNVYILLLGWFFIKGDMQYAWSLVPTFHFFNIKYWWSFATLPFGLFLGTFYLLTLIAILRYYNLLIKQGIKVQKKIKLTYWLWALSLFGLFFVPFVSYHHLLIVCVPLAICIGILLSQWKQKLAAEVLHLFVLIGVLYLHFQ